MFFVGSCRMAHKCFKVFRLSVNFIHSQSLHDFKNLTVVRTVEKTIDKNTGIFIESPIHVVVQPIDVNDMKSHDKMIMTLYSSGKDTNDVQVKQTSKRLEVSNKNSHADSGDVCLVRVPYQLKVQVTTTDKASVEVSKVEGEEILIKTEKGNVKIQDLKAQTIRVESEEGEVTSEGRLQAANIDLKTGLNSAIKCNNIMANSFIVTTHAGPIAVKSCYSDRSHFTTLMGNINLEHLHRVVLIDVIQHGNLHIGSFSGSLQASLKSGDVYVMVSQLTEKSSIFIHEKGKVELLIPDILKNLPATNLIADKIDVDSKILELGRFMDDSHPKRFRFEKEPQTELHIVCKNGSIVLKETNLMPFVFSNMKQT